MEVLEYRYRRSVDITACNIMDERVQLDSYMALYKEIQHILRIKGGLNPY